MNKHYSFIPRIVIWFCLIVAGIVGVGLIVCMCSMIVQLILVNTTDFQMCCLIVFVVILFFSMLFAERDDWLK